MTMTSAQPGVPDLRCRMCCIFCSARDFGRARICWHCLLRRFWALHTGQPLECCNLVTLAFAACIKPCI